MPKAKKPAAKAKPKTPKTPVRPKAASTTNRRLKIPSYHRSFSLHKRIKPTRPLPGAFRLLGRSLLTLKRHWKLFLAIILVYGVLNIILVRGLAGGSDLAQVKSALSQTFGGHGSRLTTGLTLFVYLLGSSGNSSNANAGIYQTLLVLLVSLATIWALRQVYSKTVIRARDAFYRGIYPLVPFILVLLTIGLQLLPLLIAVLLYSTIISGGIAVYVIEKILWIVLFVILALASLYMICSSLFALYVVTLPNMTPMKALRSARELIRHRRWLVLRKILFLPLALIVVAAVIMFPLILFATVAAEWAFFVLSMLGLIVIHSYMYALYRELLE
jgi:hypothetical protein